MCSSQFELLSLVETTSFLFAYHKNTTYESLDASLNFSSSSPIDGGGRVDFLMSSIGGKDIHMERRYREKTIFRSPSCFSFPMRNYHLIKLLLNQSKIEELSR